MTAVIKNSLYAGNSKHSPNRMAAPSLSGRAGGEAGGDGGGCRGLRNNNPLNIRRSSDHWQGLSAEQTDSQFFQFQTLAYGFRAAFLIIKTYMLKYGLVTPKQIISRWAPAGDHNNTAGYISIVCATAHMEPDQPLHWDFDSEMVYLVQAMALVECGVFIDGVEIREGYQLALHPSPPPKGRE